MPSASYERTVRTDESFVFVLPRTRIGLLMFDDITMAHESIDPSATARRSSLDRYFSSKLVSLPTSLPSSPSRQTRKMEEPSEETMVLSRTLASCRSSYAEGNCSCILWSDPRNNHSAVMINARPTRFPKRGGAVRRCLPPNKCDWHLAVGVKCSI